MSRRVVLMTDELFEQLVMAGHPDRHIDWGTPYTETVTFYEPTVYDSIHKEEAEDANDTGADARERPRDDT